MERSKVPIDVSVSLSPGRLRNATRSELTSTLRELRRTRVATALKDRSRAERARAGVLLLDLEAARQDLIAAELADLRDALEANDSELRRGIQQMRQARSTPEDLTGVLTAARRLLKAVQRVVDVTE